MEVLPFSQQAVVGGGLGLQLDLDVRQGRCSGAWRSLPLCPGPGPAGLLRPPGAAHLGLPQAALPTGRQSSLHAQAALQGLERGRPRHRSGSRSVVCKVAAGQRSSVRGDQHMSSSPCSRAGPRRPQGLRFGGSQLHGQPGVGGLAPKALYFLLAVPYEEQPLLRASVSVSSCSQVTLMSSVTFHRLEQGQLRLVLDSDVISSRAATARLQSDVGTVLRIAKIPALRCSTVSK